MLLPGQSLGTVFHHQSKPGTTPYFHSIGQLPTPLCHLPPPEPNIAIQPLFASVALPSIVVVVAAVPVVFSVAAPFGSSVEVVVYEPLPGIDAAVDVAAKASADCCCSYCR